MVNKEGLLERTHSEYIRNKTSLNREAQTTNAGPVSPEEQVTLFVQESFS